MTDTPPPPDHAPQPPLAEGKREALCNSYDCADRLWCIQRRMCKREMAGEEPEAFHWTRCADVDEMQAFFLSRLPAIRDAARDLGYAIGLHGSTRRDLDLIAAPWIDEPGSKDDLASAVQYAATGGLKAEYSFQWTVKPSGRVAVSIPCCWTDFGYGTPNLGHVDLSVMPAIQDHAALAQLTRERDVAVAREARLREAGITLLQHLDSCKQIERGAGGMTIEAQIARSHLIGVRAVWVEDFRAASTSEPEGGA